MSIISNSFETLGAAFLVWIFSIRLWCKFKLPCRRVGKERNRKEDRLVVVEEGGEVDDDEDNYMLYYVVVRR